MMKNLIRKLALPLVFIPIMILAGCYTQVGGVKGEDTPDESSYNNDYTDSAGGGGQYAYEDYGDPRYSYGFNYYYPPYYDPWFYGARPVFGVGYGYYDPFMWGYAPAYYYGGVYAPYYPPAYGWAYGGSYYGSGHGTELKGYGTKRTIGNMRAVSSPRAMESGYAPGGSGSSMSLPSGAARGSAMPAATTKTSTGRPGGSSGSGVTRTGSGRTGSNSGSGTSARPSTPQSRPSGGASRGGSSRGGSERSYTPPPSPPPASSGNTSGGSSDRGGSSSSGSSSGSSSSGTSRGGSRR